MNIALRPEMAHLVKQMVESGEYRSADDVIQAALELLDQKARAESRLEGLLQEAENSGEGIELTPEIQDEIEREALQRLRSGE